MNHDLEIVLALWLGWTGYSIWKILSYVSNILRIMKRWDEEERGLK